MLKLLRRLGHYVAYLIAAAVIAVSLVALGLRLWIMPDIDRFRPQIEALAGEAIGLPVRIGVLRADWQGLTPRLRLEDVRFEPPGQPPPLILPRVEAKVSWSSLLFAELRLSSMEITNPSLVVRLDKQRIVHVAGVPVNTPGGDSVFLDWLLRQRLVAVRQGTLVWQDELLGAPPLTLEDLDLVLFNRLNRHRLGLLARPPQEVAQRLDLRGDFRGRTVSRLKEFTGQLYARLDGGSAEALRTWAPWAQESVKSGTGSLRCWLDIAEGRVKGLLGDVQLDRVRLGLAEDLADIVFEQFTGRVGWRQEKDGQDYFVERLSFVSPQGERAGPSSVRMHLVPTPEGKVKSLDVETEDLRLEALTALSGAVPLPRPAHDLIERLKPRGLVKRLRLHWEDARHYDLSASLQDAGVSQSAELPGLTGVSAEIEANGEGGRAEIRSRGLELDYPKVFRHPLNFDRLDTDVLWEAQPKGGHVLRIEDLRMANAELEGDGRARITLSPGASPLLDIRAHLKRGEGKAVWRYLPRVVGDQTYEWVKASILGGQSPDTRLVLKGPVDRFPYEQGGGEFLVSIQVRDALLEYAPGWPRIEGIHGLLEFRGRGMTIQAQRGRILDTEVGPVSGILPDLHAVEDISLVIRGQARGRTAAFLDFVRQSPVFDYTGRFTEHMRAGGSGVLQLQLDLPLHHIDDTRVQGEYRLAGNSLTPDKGLPTLTDINGSLVFTKTALHGQQIAARLHGQPIRVDISSEKGGLVRAGLQGRLAAADLAQWLPPAVAKRLRGSVAYQAEASLRQRKVALTLNSDLTGLAIDYPAPLGKAAEQAVHLSVGTAEAGIGEARQYQIRYGGRATARVAQVGDGDTRIGVQFGEGEARVPEGHGIVLRGTLQSLDLDAWRRIADEPGEPLPVRDVNLSLTELLLLDRRYQDINIQAKPVRKGWWIKLASHRVQGEVTYDEAIGLPGKRLLARFERLALPKAETPEVKLREETLLEMPRSIDLTVQSLSVAGRELGSVKSRLEAEKTGLRVRELVWTTPESRMNGGGWLSASPQRMTQFDIDLEVTDLAGFMTRLGLPKDIQGGVATLQGSIGWLGRPENFELDRLNGNLKAKLKNGRFLKLDPGAGRLLGILSLQALPRRAVLDFRDVFSEGYSFDQIVGDVHIDRGVLYLPELKIDGPSAKVQMNGKVDLNRETQTLRLTIQPRLEDTMAVAGAILGGPVVGVGALVASKLLQNPLGKAATFEYMVQGGWAEPVVKRLPRPKPPEGEAPAGLH